MVTYRRNDYPEPRPGVRMTVAERRQLRRAGRERDSLIRRMLERGVPVWQLVEVCR